MLSIAAFKKFSLEIALYTLLAVLFSYLIPRYSVSSEYEYLVWDLQLIWFFIVGSFGPPFVCIWIFYSVFGSVEDNHPEEQKCMTEQLYVSKIEIDGNDSRESIVHGLEAKLTSLTKAHSKLNNEYNNLEESFHRQSRELSQAKAVSDYYSNQLDEYDIDDAEIKRRVIKEHEDEHEASITVALQTLSNEHTKAIEELEKAHEKKIAAIELEVGERHQTESYNQSMTIKALELSALDAQRTLSISYENMAEEMFKNKSLRTEVAELEIKLLTKTEEADRQLLNVSRLEEKIRKLQTDLSKRLSKEVERGEPIKDLEVGFLEQKKSKTTGISRERSRVLDICLPTFTILSLSSPGYNSPPQHLYLDRQVIKYNITTDCSISIFNRPIHVFLAKLKMCFTRMPIRPSKQALDSRSVVSDAIAGDCIKSQPEKAADQRRHGRIFLRINRQPIQQRSTSVPELCRKRSYDDDLDVTLSPPMKRRASESDRVQLAPASSNLEDFLRYAKRMRDYAGEDTIMSNAIATQALPRARLSVDEENEISELLESTHLMASDDEENCLVIVEDEEDIIE